MLLYGSQRSILGDGGSYPECHVAQYPLGMGKKKVRERLVYLNMPTNMT